jgi:transcriptional regulator
VKVAWRFITDSDVECLVKDYDLTEAELQVLQLRRKGVGAEAIPFKIYYQRSQAFAITAKLAAKIMQMYQNKL